MVDNKFNLKNPKEKLVHDRLQKYLQISKSWEEANKLIYNDFPYLEERLSNCVDHMIFEHFCLSDKGERLGDIRKIAFLSDNNLHEPFATHTQGQFMINRHQDIFLAVSAVNPHYTFSEAKLAFTVKMNKVEVVSVKHTMSADERTQVFYIPLKVFDHYAFTESDSCNFEIEVEDGYRPGVKFEGDFAVYLSDKLPSDIFTVTSAWVFRNDGDKSDVISINDLEHLRIFAAVKVSERFDTEYFLEGQLLFSRADANHDEMTFSRQIRIYEDEENEGGDFFLYMNMFNCQEENEDYNDNIDLRDPTYIVEPGEYNVTLCIMGDPVWSQTIKMVEDETGMEEVIDDRDGDSVAVSI